MLPAVATTRSLVQRIHNPHGYVCHCDPGAQDFDYGKREGSHTDPDGNLIRFGSPLRAARR
jgi:hypothetical protein